MTVEEWVAAIAQQIEEDIWHYSILFDVTAAGARLPTQLQAAEITRLAVGLYRELGARGAIAFAIATDEGYADVRGWVDVVGVHLPYTTRVFRTSEEAIRWLDSLPSACSRSDT